MFKKKTKISIFTDYIQVGGGPMGYTYNMKQGLKSLKYNDYKISFIGFDITLSFYKILPFNYVKKIFRFLHRKVIVVQRFFALRTSDICVFQGYQNSCYAHVAKQHHSLCIYMPHSPSIMADEQKMIWDLSNISPYSMSLYKQNYATEQKLFELADYIVFPSKNSADAYLKEWKTIIEKKKVYFIKSGTIERKTDSSYPIRETFPKKTIFAFIGRYVTHKGFDIFCKTAELFKDNNDIAFVSAGSGSLEFLAKTHNIHNLGYISDIGSLIKNVDVLIISNRIAYYDLLPIECAAYGKPMIFSSVGGNIDQHKDFPDSLIFNSEDTEDLAKKVNLAVKELNNDETWGKQNREAYFNNFTAKEMMRRWINFFKTILQT